MNPIVEYLEQLAVLLRRRRRRRIVAEVRAHLLEMAGAPEAAMAAFRAAAARATNSREQQYLTTEAARLAATE